MRIRVKKSPPNYRKGKPWKKCGNCKAYKPEKPQGFCTMYQTHVGINMVCDKWY